MSSSFTVVTSLVDIRRDLWVNYVRNYRRYLDFLEQILAMDVHLYVFIEEKGYEFVKEHRKGKEDKTVIEVITLEDLKGYQYLDRIKEIQGRDQYKRCLLYTSPSPRDPE